MSNPIFFCYYELKSFSNSELDSTIKKMNLLHGIRLNNFHNISTPSVIFITPCLQDYGIHYPTIPRNMRLLQKLGTYLTSVKILTTSSTCKFGLYSLYVFLLSFWREFIPFNFCFYYLNKCLTTSHIN